MKYEILIVVILALSGCSKMELKKQAEQVATDIKVQTNMIDMHAKAVDGDAEGIAKTTSEPETKAAAGRIINNAGAIRKANENIAKSGDSVLLLADGIERTELALKDEKAKTGSSSHKRLVWLNYASVVAIIAGIAAFLILKNNIGLMVAAGGAVSFAVTAVLIKYLGLITAIAGWALLIAVLILAYKLIKGQVVVEDLVKSYDFAKGLIKDKLDWSNHDELKKGVNVIQHPETKIAVDKAIKKHKLD